MREVAHGRQSTTAGRRGANVRGAQWRTLGGAVTFHLLIPTEIRKSLGRMTLMRRALLLLTVAALGCSDRMAMGDVNSVIVVAEDSLWSQVQDTVLGTLQPRIFAVRDEPTFQLTHVSPTSEDWAQLRRFRQILAIGQPTDPWVQMVLEEADTTVTAPAIVEADDVWARSQRATAVVVPEQNTAAAIDSLVVPIAELLDQRYRVFARTRMYFSGHDEALADTLRQMAGFTIDLPQVYRWRQVGDSAYMFLNDEPDASQLVRSMLVTWRTGTEGFLSEETALTWRDSIAGRFYDWGQVSLRDRLETRRLQGSAQPEQSAFEVRGAWSGTLDDFPQGGPFITWIVDCPSQNRRYLLDTWLYAPTRDKYQYMIQLETLLQSFRCNPGGATGGTSPEAAAEG